MLREAAISDDGSVLIRKRDHDVVQREAAATDATWALRPTRLEVLFDRGCGEVAFSGGACFADVDRVGS